MAAGPVPILGVPRRKDQEIDTPETGHGPNGLKPPQQRRGKGSSSRWEEVLNNRGEV